MANFPFLVQRPVDNGHVQRARSRRFSAGFESAGGNGSPAMMLSILLHAVLVLGGVSVVNALPAKSGASELVVFVEQLDADRQEPDRAPDVKEPEAASVPRERPVMAAAKPNKLIVAEGEATPGEETVLNGDEPSETLSHGFVSAEASLVGAGVGPAPVAARTQTLAPKVSPAKPVVDVKQLRRRWLASVNRAVRSRVARDYSQRSLRRHEEGLVRVRLTVDASGRITSAQVLSSSGFASLDRSALQSVQSVGQVPAPPPELAWADQPIIVPLDYRLK